MRSNIAWETTFDRNNLGVGILTSLISMLVGPPKRCAGHVFGARLSARPFRHPVDRWAAPIIECVGGVRCICLLNLALGTDGGVLGIAHAYRCPHRPRASVVDGRLSSRGSKMRIAEARYGPWHTRDCRLITR
jgi:hypothetical protein